MTLPYAHYSLSCRLRPPVNVSALWNISLRPVTADLQTATAGTFAAGPATADVIAQINQASFTLNNYDANGITDPADYARLTALIPYLMRELGLYPTATLAALASTLPG